MQKKRVIAFIPPRRLEEKKRSLLPSGVFQILGRHQPNLQNSWEEAIHVCKYSDGSWNNRQYHDERNRKW